MLSYEGYMLLIYCSKSPDFANARWLASHRRHMTLARYMTLSLFEIRILLKEKKS